MNWKRNSVLILLLLLTVFVRFYRLGESATFFWDQAYDLTRINDYFQRQKISLIGPISEDGSKVYSSLYYYAVMPFAVIFKFSAVSTTIGAAFYGALTVLFLCLLIRKNKGGSLLSIIALGCLAIWFPLVETSRWAWNPNLIVFWVALGLYLDQYDGWWWKIAAGLFFGLSVHQHYLAIVAVATFLIIKTLVERKKSNFGLFMGLVLAILPFVVFDITHPPGLFLSRILYFNQTDGGLGGAGLLQKIINNFIAVGQYYTHFNLLTGLLLLLVGVLVWIDGRSKPKNLVYIAPWVAQIIGVAFFNASYSHYFLGGLVFFVYWLIIKRETILPLLIFLTLMIGSVLTIYPQVYNNPWNKKEWQPNIATIEKIDEWIVNKCFGEKLDRANIAVLGSDDTNTYGWKYRSLLSLKKISFEPKDNYHDSDYLFVVSESSENALRSDLAVEMDNFKNGTLISATNIDQSNWSVYLFRK